MAFFAACGGDGGDTGTIVTERTVAARPSLPESTGFAEVDQVIIAALARDDIELAGLTGYQRLPCRAPDAEGTEPLCRAGEEPGTVVEVLAGSSCENSWVRPESVPDAYRLSLASGSPKLLTVYVPRITEATFGGGFGATSVAVFDTGVKDTGLARGVALYINNGRTVWLRGDCRELDELLAPELVESYLIEPAARLATPTAVAAPTEPVESPAE